MRLIDADTLKVSITRYCAKHIEHQKWRRLKDHTSELCRDICFAVDVAPTVEERKTGKWIYDVGGSLFSNFKCSVCEEYAEDQVSKCEWNYCPSCGARMEK